MYLAPSSERTKLAGWGGAACLHQNQKIKPNEGARPQTELPRANTTTRKSPENDNNTRRSDDWIRLVRFAAPLGWARSGRVGSVRVGSVRVGSGLFWSGRYGSARFRSNRPDSPGGLHLELVPLAGVSLENRRSQVLLSHLPVPRAHQRAYAVHLQVGGWTGSVIGRGQGGGW